MKIFFIIWWIIIIIYIIICIFILDNRSIYLRVLKSISFKNLNWRFSSRSLNLALVLSLILHTFLFDKFMLPVTIMMDFNDFWRSRRLLILTITHVSFKIIRETWSSSLVVLLLIMGLIWLIIFWRNTIHLLMTLKTANCFLLTWGYILILTILNNWFSDWWIPNFFLLKRIWLLNN